MEVSWCSFHQVLHQLSAGFSTCHIFSSKSCWRLDVGCFDSPLFARAYRRLLDGAKANLQKNNPNKYYHKIWDHHPSSRKSCPLKSSKFQEICFLGESMRAAPLQLQNRKRDLLLQTYLDTPGGHSRACLDKKQVVANSCVIWLVPTCLHILVTSLWVHLYVHSVQLFESRKHRHLHHLNAH